MGHLFDTLGHGWTRPVRDADPEIMVTITPMAWGWVEMAITEWLCAATGHRYCSSKLMTWAHTVGDKHTRTFTIPTSAETVTAYCEWMGWSSPFRADDEDEAA